MQSAVASQAGSQVVDCGLVGAAAAAGALDFGTASAANVGSAKVTARKNKASLSMRFPLHGWLVLKNYSAPLNLNCQLLGGFFSIGSDWAFFQKYDDVMTIVAIGTLVYGVTAASSYSGGGGDFANCTYDPNIKTAQMTLLI